MLNILIIMFWFVASVEVTKLCAWLVNQPSDLTVFGSIFLGVLWIFASIKLFVWRVI